MGRRFTLLGAIREVETIAVGKAIRELARLQDIYGRGRWRKRKGIARVELPNATICTAEVPWYEATGIGRQKLKIKRIIEV